MRLVRGGASSRRAPSQACSPSGRYISVSHWTPPQAGPDGPPFGQPYGVAAPFGSPGVSRRDGRLATCWRAAPGVIRAASVLQLLLALVVAVYGLVGLVRGGIWLIDGSGAHTTTPQDGEAATWVAVIGFVLIVVSVGAMLLAASGFAAAAGVLKGSRAWWATAVAWQGLLALVAAVLHDAVSVFVGAIVVTEVVVLLLPTSRDYVRPQTWP